MYVPVVIEQYGKGERSYDLYSRLLKDRIVRVDGEITADSASIITSELLFLESQDPHADITMYINSPGGDVCAGFAIYDVMNYIQPDVRTVVNGRAMSMGSILLAGGTKGKRHALPNAEIMIHQPIGGSQGKASDMEISWNEMQKCKKKIIDFYMEHCDNGKTYEEIEADIKDDHYMTPSEAMKYGLIDSIFTRRKVSSKE